MEVFPSQVLEGVEMPSGWEARLGSRYVEADDATVAVFDREFGNLAGPGGVPHRGDESADPNPVASLGSCSLTATETE
jgi:hypothetical protein